MQDSTMGQENNMSLVALADCDHSPPHIESTIQPINGSQIQPCPKAWYMGPQEDLNISVSDELRHATFTLPADQHQLPPSDHSTNTFASQMVVGNPFEASAI
jgi:hypothetical protein